MRAVVTRCLLASPAVGKYSRDARRVLSREDAIKVYNKHGEKIKDSESAYGGPATTALLDACSLGSENGIAPNIFEYGCGPGRLGELLLKDVSPGAVFVACDASPVMVEAAKARLEPLGGKVIHISGDPTDVPNKLPEGRGTGTYDIFLSTYVLDLLSDDDIESVLELAWQLLAPGGQLCLSGITHGNSLVTRLGTAIWEAVHAVMPKVVGGCRCQDLTPYLGEGWKIESNTIVPGGYICSQVIVASKCPGTSS